jgi:hypothetical protein
MRFAMDDSKPFILLDSHLLTLSQGCAQPPSRRGRICELAKIIYDDILEGDAIRGLISRPVRNMLAMDPYC